MSIYVGLDCGGSSCRVLAVDEHGNSLFQGQSGAANLASTPPHKLRQHLQHAVAGCPPPAAVCGCFAGLLTEEDRQRALDLMAGLFPSAVPRAEPDYAAALYASDSPADICVIAGTGSLVCSAIDGRIAKSGGRGYLLGDEGSAFRHGLSALKLYLADPQAASESLSSAVCQHFGSLDEAMIVARLYRSSTPAALLAKLAKPLAAEAKAGNQAALDAVADECGLLAGVAVTHVQRHLPGRPSLRVALAGGLWSSAVYAEAFQRSLANLASLPIEAKVVRRAPVQGAVALAREMAER